MRLDDTVSRSSSLKDIIFFNEIGINYFFIVNNIFLFIIPTISSNIYLQSISSFSLFHHDFTKLMLNPSSESYKIWITLTFSIGNQQQEEKKQQSGFIHFRCKSSLSPLKNQIANYSTTTSYDHVRLRFETFSRNMPLCG